MAGTSTFLRALVLSVVLVGLLAVPAGASADSRFWVAPDGSDANPGTKAEPFATLERARQAVRAVAR